VQTITAAKVFEATLDQRILTQTIRPCFERVFSCRYCVLSTVLNIHPRHFHPRRIRPIRAVRKLESARVSPVYRRGRVQDATVACQQSARRRRSLVYVIVHSSALARWRHCLALARATNDVKLVRVMTSVIRHRQRAVPESTRRKRRSRGHFHRCTLSILNGSTRCCTHATH
jgi:hypothetical protein